MRAAVKVTYCLGGCCISDIRVWDDSQPWVLLDIRVWIIYSQGCCCLGDMRVWDDSQPGVLIDIRVLNGLQPGVLSA